MSRFKRIKNKSNKKSSVSIDEKIVALNKELKKTGMLSEKMTTSNVYSTSEFVPYDPGGEFPVPDPSGATQQGFTQPVSGNPDDPSNWPDAYADNSWMFNPNEVYGETNRPIFKTMDQGLINTFNAANPGNNKYPSGGAGIVFGNVAFGTGVGYIKNGHYKQVLSPGLFGNGSTNMVPPGSPYGAPYFGLFTAYRVSREEANIIMAMTGAYLDAGGYDLSKAMPVLLWRHHSNFHDGSYENWSGKKYTSGDGTRYVLSTFYLHRASNTYHETPVPEHQTNVQTRGTEDPPIYPGPIANLFGLGARAFEWLFGRAKKENEEKDYERNRRTNRPKPVGSKPEPDPISEPDPKSEPDPEKDYERNRYNNRPEVKAGVPIKNAITALGNFATDPLGAVADFFGDNMTPPAAEYSTNIAKSVLFNKPITVKQEDIPKGDIDKFFKKFNGNIPISNGKPTPYADENFYVDEKGNVKSNIGPNGEKAYYKKNNTGSVGTYSVAGYDNPLAAAGQAQTQFVIPDDGSEPYFLYTDHAYHNLTSDDPGEVPDAVKKFLSGAIHALTGKGDPTKPNTGAMSGYPPNVKGDVKTEFRIPYSKLPENIKAKVDFELKYQELFRQGKVKGKFESFDISNISESVALGHFEPEELNVDIEDLRKGIMPEYPKNPPAEMIDGYHEKSRIRSKNAKNEEPYLKIDKTDLIRNHRLKSSEVDEMMDTINMINDYIKKHPEDLIHAQMRYPVDDPRLAELNWKMDQMLDAGEEYLDSNFRVNDKLFKRAVDRTKNNIKLTDPEYVQQNYNELRGTTQGKIINPKPRDIKLKSKLKKHLPQYESKSFFKHVDSKDFKKISERREEQKRLKLSNETALNKITKERQEYIDGEMSKQMSDWRKDISESDFTNITKGNKVGQTFQHVSGATITLDNTMSDPSDQPSQVTLDLGFGEKITVDAPSGNEYGIAGVTKPLDKKVMQKQSVKTAEEINDQIEASEKASESKSARVPVETGDLGYKSTDEILDEVGDQWTYDEYMSMLDAIADKAAAAEEPIAKAIAEYSPTGSTPGDVPISLIDAQEAITNARNKAEQALHQAWERYNKVPDLPSVPDESEEGISSDDIKFLNKQQTLVNLTKGLGAIGLPNDFAQWTINYAKGDMKPITKFSPGMERQVRNLVLDKFKKNPNAKTVDIQYGDYGFGAKALPTRLGLGRFNATKLDNGKIRIQDTFNVDKDFTTIGFADIVPGLQKTADRLVDISYKTRNIKGRTDKGGITIDVIIDSGFVKKKRGSAFNKIKKFRNK